MDYNANIFYLCKYISNQFLRFYASVVDINQLSFVNLNFIYDLFSKL
uniref:Hexokinase II n=1 Tax=Dolomedes sulfureus TaxID=492288 RepID=A0A0P0D159_9ARAC|nr:hexokinase II [Dolomedes sulfureus]